MNFDTKNVETKIVENTGRWIEGPWAGVAKVLGVFYGVSGKKGTPGFEIVIQAAPGEDFESYKKKFPTTRMFAEDSREQYEIEVGGPISTTVFWMSENSMNPEQPLSTFQQTLQMVDALGVREEFDAETKQSTEDWANAFHKVAQGQKAGFLLDKNIREYESNGTIKESITTAIHPFGSFAVPAGEVMDLQKKLEKNPKNHVNEERIQRTSSPASQTPSEAPDDFDF